MVENKGILRYNKSDKQLFSVEHKHTTANVKNSVVTLYQMFAIIKAQLRRHIYDIWRKIKKAAKR